MKGPAPAGLFFGGTCKVEAQLSKLFCPFRRQAHSGLADAFLLGWRSP